MHPWKQALAEGAVAGTLAGLSSALALALAGRRQNADAAAPLNAISHWFWGDPALRQDGVSWRHTVTGTLVHHAASILWGTLHARAWGIRSGAKRPGAALAGASIAAALACFVDYRLTPRRLTPGFEHRLSSGQMAAVYGCFALGLAAGSLFMGRRKRRGNADGA